MNNSENKLVITATNGIDHELSSVAFTIANGALTENMEVTVFLTSAGIDLVRKRGVELTHIQPLSPLKTLIDNFLSRGGKIVACPPCVASRGYIQDDLIEGVEIAGASGILNQLKSGAASLSF
jgi:predicted peroxiredoxin